MDLRSVGTKAKASVKVIRIAEYTGVLVIIQKSSEISAPVSEIQSSNTIFFSPLTSDSRNTLKHPRDTKPITQAPGPAFTDSCPRKLVPVIKLHTNQENA